MNKLSQSQVLVDELTFLVIDSRFSGGHNRYDKGRKVYTCLGNSFEIALTGQCSYQIPFKYGIQLIKRQNVATIIF